MTVVEVLFVGGGIVGGGMIAIYYVAGAFYAHRHIKAIDRFARGWTWRSADFLLFKVLRLGAYGMACAFPRISRRNCPGKDFSQLPGNMKRHLTVFFWWFVVAGASMAMAMVVFYGFYDPID